ncbi:MAG: NAD-dependent epimerase/dehydratase family protein [Clostridiales bacterium]|nr:NAD-dependent epimerase/dehydratase family protein [Clostridiales bacterium]
MLDLVEEIKKLEGPIAVFGAGGFIGANILRSILEIRDDCYGVTHQTTIPWRLSGLPTKNVLYGDLTKPQTIKALFNQDKFRTVLNFAAYGGYPKQKDIEQIYKVNVLGAANLMEIASGHGFAAFVQAGSSSEYGENSRGPKEDAELLPNSHYAVSKIADWALVRYYGKIRRQPVIALRFYSAYGPYEEPDRLIPTLLREGMKGGYPPLVDPDISRDFIYIDDVIEAVILAATRGVYKIPGGSLNIATGEKTSIKEIVQLVQEIFGIRNEPNWQTMPNREWDLKDWYGNPVLAKEILGWQAKTPLKNGLEKTIEWMKSDKKEPARAKPLRMPKISAVIACYLDGQAIPIMHERLTKVFTGLNVDYEIVFVNDASPDKSDEVLKELTAKDHHVIAIEHSRNFGTQGSFLSGMQVATGDAVVLLDGDLQDPPEVIREFYKKWTEGYDVVYGRRVKRRTTKFLSACYKLFYRIFRGVAYVPMPLDAGDFSLMDRKVVNQLIALPETDQFIRGLRAWVGFKQTGVDYTRPERMFGVTTNRLIKNIWWAKKAIFSFSFVPLELLSYFGLILTGVSFLALIWQIIARIIYPDIPHGIPTIIVLILFFGAIQIMAISIIGEYLMRIFEETKKRPKFIRKSIRYGSEHLTSSEEIDDFIKSKMIQE